MTATERADWWNDAAEADALAHGSDMWGDDDDEPSAAELAEEEDDDRWTRGSR